MKKRKTRFWSILTAVCMAASLAGCANKGETNDTSGNTEALPAQNAASESASLRDLSGAVITLSDDVVLVDGSVISKDSSSAVYASNDIIFYLANQGESYGEGSAEDAPTPKTVIRLRRLTNARSRQAIRPAANPCPAEADSQTRQPQIKAHLP